MCYGKLMEETSVVKQETGMIEKVLPREEETELVEVLKDDDQMKSSENSEKKESVEHLPDDSDMSSMGLNDNSIQVTDIITPVRDENLEYLKWKAGS